MSLVDDEICPKFDMLPTNRELAKDSDLDQTISGLEKIRSLPDDMISAAMKKLVRKAPDRIKEQLQKFQQRNINCMKLGFDGLIRSLAHEAAEEIRWNTATKSMNTLSKVAPLMKSFSTN